jgi:putative DNA primase/helicase
VFRRADTVKPAAVQWLWNGWLAAGWLHLLAGKPSVGKTTLALSMAAAISTGGQWPDGAPAEQGTVLIWSGEDGLADTLVPRLKAAGADLARIAFVASCDEDGKPRPFDPATDIDALREKIGRTSDVRLVIIDPVVAVIGNGNSHNNAETRRALAPLVALASSCNVAVLGIHHFSKGTSGTDPTERVTGSLAFAAVSRLVLVASKSEDSDGNTGYVLTRGKSNNGPEGGGFAYTTERVCIQDGIEASRVVWGEAVTGSALDLVNESEAGGNNAVVDWLRRILAEGTAEAAALRAAAQQEGYPWRSVQRALRKVGAANHRVGFGKDQRSVWTLEAATRAGPTALAPLAPVSECGASGASGSDIPLPLSRAVVDVDSAQAQPLPEKAS